MKKVILFDIYQTLIDVDINKENQKINETRAWENFAKSLKQYGIHIAPVELIKLISTQRANFYRGKDKKIYHYNFAKNNIPVIFYFNGVHEDYHRPTDTVDKINFEKIEKISRLVFFTAWELANRDERIVVDNK